MNQATSNIIMNILSLETNFLTKLCTYHESEYCWKHRIDLEHLSLNTRTKLKLFNFTNNPCYISQSLDTVQLKKFENYHRKHLFLSFRQFYVFQVAFCRNKTFCFSQNRVKYYCVKRKQFFSFLFQSSSANQSEAFLFLGLN